MDLDVVAVHGSGGKLAAVVVNCGCGIRWR